MPEKIIDRRSSAWYFWAASALVLITDVALHGITSLNIFLVPLSIAFAGIMFSGKRAEDRAIARFQEQPPPIGKTTTMPFATRVSLIGLLEKSLSALWFILLTSSVILFMGGNPNLSWAIFQGMIGLALFAGPIKILTTGFLLR